MKDQQTAAHCMPSCPLPSLVLRTRQAVKGSCRKQYAHYTRRVPSECFFGPIQTEHTSVFER